MKKSKRLAAMALAMSITAAGCSNENSNDAKKKEYLLQETLFDKAIVASVNGNIAVVRPENSTEIIITEHKHYFDITSGQWVTDYELCNSKGVLHVTIEEMGSILEYLTEEEMKKANEGTLTDDDIIAIMYRIKQSDDKSLTLTKER